MLLHCRWAVAATGERGRRQEEEAEGGGRHDALRPQPGVAIVGTERKTGIASTAAAPTAATTAACAVVAANYGGGGDADRTAAREQQGAGLRAKGEFLWFALQLFGRRVAVPLFKGFGAGCGPDHKKCIPFDSQKGLFALCLRNNCLNLLFTPPGIIILWVRFYAFRSWLHFIADSL